MITSSKKPIKLENGDLVAIGEFVAVREYGGAERVGEVLRTEAHGSNGLYLVIAVREEPDASVRVFERHPRMGGVLRKVDPRPEEVGLPVRLKRLTQTWPGKGFPNDRHPQDVQVPVPAQLLVTCVCGERLMFHSDDILAADCVCGRRFAAHLTLHMADLVDRVT